MLHQQVEALEAEMLASPDGCAYDEKRVKALLLMTKTLQSMEEAEREYMKARNDRDSGPGNIVELRSRLEARIAAFANSLAEEVPGNAEQEGTGADTG